MKLGLLVGLALGVIGASAQAAQINGGFSMTGGFTPTGSSNLASATGIDFWAGGVSGTPTGTFQVAGPIEGDFVGLVAIGQTGTIKDLTFDPFTGPIVDFYTINGISFRLESITEDFASSTALVLSGTGTVFADGFEATQADWVFTGNRSRNTATFSWSASSGAAPGPGPSDIPEPATLGLLASGLLGLGFMRRRKAA